MGWLREKRAAWDDVHVGAFVYDKTGKPWKVAGVDGRTFFVRDERGGTATLHPNISAPVDALVDEDARAIHTLSTILGGVVIG